MPVLTPTSLPDLVAAMRLPGPIAIRGAGYSQGGQTDAATVIDTSHLNRIVCITDRSVTVEAGCRWSDVIRALNAVGRSVAEMQSYVNFSVGGAISVNCHGRGMQFGTIHDTILTMQVVTPDTTTHIVRPGDALFAAVVGGYGLVAVIYSVKLLTVENVPLRRNIRAEPRRALSEFLRQVASDESVVFYHGFIYPHVTDYVHHRIFCRTSVCAATNDLPESTSVTRLVNQVGEHVLRRGSMMAKIIRGHIEPMCVRKDLVCWRNQEMWYDVEDRTPYTERFSKTYLQEYFIALPHIDNLLNVFFELTQRYHVNVLNISVRLVRTPLRRERPMLDYAPELRVAMVVYYNMWRNTIDADGVWTREMLDWVVSHGGAFYLPYLPHATPGQVRRAYPRFDELMAMKARWDPNGKLESRWSVKYIRAHRLQSPDRTDRLMPIRPCAAAPRAIAATVANRRFDLRQ